MREVDKSRFRGQGVDILLLPKPKERHTLEVIYLLVTKGSGGGGGRVVGGGGLGVF